MRRIVIAIGTTITGLVLLLSWPTSLNQIAGVAAASTGSANGASSATTAAATAPAAAAGAAPAPANAAPAPAAAAPAAAAPAAPKTYTGSNVSTQFGPVQVQITVANGAVTAAKAISYPSGNGQSNRINAYAIPTLNKEAISAGSAKIDMVSGATYSSGGYIKSLQSAIDQAGL